MLIVSIVLFLAVILFVGFLLPLAMAQQQMTTTTPQIPPSSSLSITTIPPLTPEEQEQQNRLQNVIAATTANLNETQKQISGVVFTPRWSEPVWVNANSIAVLIAYCLPGEFADSGQEILGGFELEVLESHAVALPQGFMAWMAVVGNEDEEEEEEENVRLPAALGVICASDLNQTDTRVLSPEEQQEINNINQQFTTIQNTQVTNIDQVINIINDVTGNTTTPQNETGGITEQPLTVEIISNAIEGPTYTVFRLESNVTGGTEPYTYSWGVNGTTTAALPDNMMEVPVFPGAPRIVTLTVTDSKNQTASDSIQLTVEAQPLIAEIITNATQAVAPATIKFDADWTGGTPPYSYSWSVPDIGLIDYDRSITQMFFDPGTFTYILTVTDSKGQTASDTVQIVIRERLGGGVLPPPETGQEGQPPGGGLLPGIAPGEEGGTVGPTEEQPQVPEGEEGDTTGGGGGGGEDSAASPPSDDTGEGGEEGGTPPSTTTEEGEDSAASPPDDDTGEGG